MFVSGVVILSELNHANIILLLLLVILKLFCYVTLFQML